MKRAHLAFHGKPGRIFLDGTSVDIETLAQIMGRGFNNWIVYFGSCATIDMKQKRILNFMDLTGTPMVMGYDREVDWLTSTAADLLLLDRLQFYKDMRKFWDCFRDTYRGIAEIIGLRVFHK